tara:strand:+ start:3326 stop:3811 length:486 start_codon:yes stop_codon:yes gene_type:complete
MSYSERTYGEVVELEPLYDEIVDLLSEKELKLHNYIFCDYGSGTGKIINYFAKYFKQAIGFEIDKDRYVMSVISSVENTVFKNNSFFDEKIVSPSVLFLNNLCFRKGTNKRLSLKFIDECKQNDLVISTTKMPLMECYFVKDITLECSWGKSELYIYFFII